ncbi:hypothetical protein H6G81_05640 [Scytonema hofmannii FACHB-248]|uniref:Uncharacterized protein n=2 Tax=Scytonema hofmannii TaxID=34078 RepID=A0ABR8GKW8_9CYAN|nr:hypothetical protein [[Scytonema hofmanni] UTEX B 1581]MBD2604024.1 hypothetical protein [Scytonema hofmannii FACHB-248]
MNKFLLTLFSSPVLFASVISMVMMTQPSQANQTVDAVGNRLSCIQSPHSATKKMVCIRVSNTIASASTPGVKPTQVQPNEDRVIEFTAPQAQLEQSGSVKLAYAPVQELPELEFTDEESETSIKLFGCDCPPCLNALRQMRGLPGLAG